ncbi:MAG: hypothetical protein QXU72_01790 [Thermofilum sp.]
MYAGSLYYDVSLTLVPEAVRLLREFDHPNKAELLQAGSQLYSFVANASERLRAITLPPELQQFREVMRYGFLSLKRVFAEGDWRAHVLFTELVAELKPYRHLLEWLLRAPSLPSKPSVVEVNTVAPLFSAKLGAGAGASVTLVQKRELAEVSIVGEVVEEYFRRYDVQGQVVELEDLSRPAALKGTADVIFAGSPDAWRVGWDTLLSLALTVLKPKGYLAYLLPGNFREGLKTLLRFWDISPFPEPLQAVERLRKSGFGNVIVNTQECFYAIFAQRR